MKKKFLAILLALAMILPLCPVISLPAFAATSGTTGDCTWTLNGTVLTISGNGAMANYSEKNVDGINITTAPWGSSVTKVVIENGVTNIGAFAFRSCSSLTCITIPNSVTSIGSSAFYDCTSLTSITIPNSVTSIGSSAFYFCFLTSITIPNSVISIGSYAFHYCPSLISITVQEGNPVFHSASNCLIKTKTKELIQGCNTSVIPSDGSVTSIGVLAFFNCKSITSVTIPDSITSIGKRAFASCNSLTDVWYQGTEADKSKISIGADNSELTGARWHYNVCDEEDHIYSSLCDDNCNTCGSPNLKAHSYDNACDTVCSLCLKFRKAHLFLSGSKCSYCGVTGGTTGDCIWTMAETTLTVSGTGAMGNNRLGGSTVTKIVIENGVTSIGNYAFSGCYTLASVIIPDSVTNIGEYAFASCSSLTDVWYVGDRRSVANITIGTDNTHLTSATWHYLNSYCDEDCNTCGEKNPLAHKFNNACDESCNLCGKIREVPDHSFTWIIDDSENCGRDGKKHEACIVCGIKRNENTVIPATGNHVYTNDCDEACNVCGTLRTPSDHVYDNIIDKTCNVCGFTRTLPYDAYGTTGDCIWTLKGTVLTISGSGAMANYDIFNLPPWGEDLTEIVIEEGVTAIGSDAFSYNASLTTVTLPKSVKTVGEYAFDSCTSLTDVWFKGTKEERESLTVCTNNATLLSATWHHTDDADEVAITPKYAKLYLDQYLGVKFYFEKGDVSEDLQYKVLLGANENILAEGDFSDLTEEDGLYVLSFHKIGLSDFNTEFSLFFGDAKNTGIDAYNTVIKLATAGADYYTDGTKEDLLFKSIADLGKTAAGENTLYNLTYKKETPASSGSGAEEGAVLRFTGKNLLMNDAIALRLYGEADRAEAVEGIKVSFGKNNITSLCEISAPEYSTAKGKYTFTVDIFFSVSKMDSEKTVVIADQNGKICLTLTDRIDWVLQAILLKEPDNALAKQALIYIQKANEYFEKTPPVITPSAPGDETEIGGKVEL